MLTRPLEGGALPSVVHLHSHETRLFPFQYLNKSNVFILLWHITMALNALTKNDVDGEGAADGFAGVEEDCVPVDEF